MGYEKKLPDDDQRIVAWHEFQDSDLYRDIRKWAVQGEWCLDGALWRAFLAGWIECRRCAEEEKLVQQMTADMAKEISAEIDAEIEAEINGINERSD